MPDVHYYKDEEYVGVLTVDEANNTKYVDTACSTSELQNKIDELHNEGGGELVFNVGTHDITAQVIVKAKVSVYCVDGAILKNQFGGTTPMMVFNSYTQCDRLEVDCNGGTGVVIGESGVDNAIEVGYINIYDIGTATDQIGVKFRGYNFHYNFIKTVGANKAVLFDNCSDCYGDSLLSVNYVSGLVFTGSEHVFLKNVDLDSGSYVGTQIDTSHDIWINGTVWVNNTAYPGISLTYGALVGEYSSGDLCNGINLNLKCLRHGGTALKLSYTEDSIINIEVSNASLYTTSPAIATGIEFGSGLSGDIQINSRKIDASTKTSGTLYGTLNIPGVGMASNLREAGFKEGDVLPLMRIDNTSSQSITDTSYATLWSLIQEYIQWDTLPANATIKIGYYISIEPGTDETATARLYNFTDSEVMVSETSGITSDTIIWSGWETYTPTTENTPIMTVFQGKTDPGANSSTFKNVSVLIGVEL